MEAAYGHWDISGAERAREIEGSRVLVSLYSGEHDEPEVAVPAESLYELVWAYTRIDFIENGNVDRNIGP